MTATAARSTTSSSAPQVKMPATDFKPRKYDGPSREEVIAMRKQYANPAIFTMFR